MKSVILQVPKSIYFYSIPFTAEINGEKKIALNFEDWVSFSI